MAQGTLREAVALIAEQICGCATPEQRKRDIALIEAEIDRRVNAAIATMFERLRTPITDALKFAYCQGAGDVSSELTGDTETTEDDFGEAGDDYAAFAASELLTSFQQENSDD